MVKIKPFDVEQWMDENETNCTHNIAETCSSSLTLAELASLDPASISSSLNALTSKLTSSRLTYGHIRGSPELRSGIRSLYETPLEDNNILVTPGAIAANFLLFYTLLGPGDHVVCVHPCYQQLWAVPEQVGAEVSLWRLKEENNWAIDIEELKRLIKPDTKLIIINNPNNPTGVTYDKQTLEAIVKVAESNGNIPILSDEVYRPLFHSTVAPPSLLDLYPHAIVTSSFSKAYALAGIRLGWLASRNTSIIESLAVTRDYNTISVSMLDDAVGAYALSLPELKERNMKLAQTNLPILEAFVEKYIQRGVCTWVKPTAGTTAFVRFLGLNDVLLCKALMAKLGVLWVPGGRCFGVEEGEFEGYVRIGWCCETDVLKEGLKKADEFLEALDKEGFEALKKGTKYAKEGQTIIDVKRTII